MVNDEIHLRERKTKKKRSLISMMTLILMVSILVACSDDNKDQTDIKENDDIGEVGETEDTNDESEEVSNRTNDSVEDQRDLIIEETGTFETTLGTYEVTLESAEIVGAELDGETSLLDELIVLELTFKNIGDDILLAGKIIHDMEITDDLKGSGYSNGAEEFDNNVTLYSFLL